MSAKVRDQILRRQCRVTRRLEQRCQGVAGPVMSTGGAQFEASSRIWSTSAGVCNERCNRRPIGGIL